MAEIELANLSYQANQEGRTSALVTFLVQPLPSLPSFVDHFEININVPGGIDPTGTVNEAKVELHNLILRLAEETKHWAT
jgi:hypothetical protein